MKLLDSHYKYGPMQVMTSFRNLSQNTHNLLLFLLGLAISIVCIGLLIIQVDGQALLAAFQQSNKSFLLMSLIVMILGVVIRAWRIHLWSGQSGKRPFAPTLTANSIGYLGLILIPARLGEFVRLELLTRTFVMSRSELLGIMAIERAFDLLVVAMIAGIGLAGATVGVTLSGLSAHWVNISLVSALAISCGFVFLVSFNSKVLERFVRLSPRALHPWVEKFAQGLHLASRRSGGLPLITTLFIWLLELFVLYLVLQAFSVNISIFHLFLLMGLMTLSFVVPAGPAGLGVWQWVFVFALPDVEMNVAVAISACVQSVSLTAFALAGTATPILLRNAHAPAQIDAENTGIRDRFVTVVLPSYNEAGNIVQIVNALKEVLEDRAFEIIVVDDQSPDGTAKLVRDTYSGDQTVRVIERTKEKGLATAIRDGMMEARDLILVLDTDFNHDPKDAVRMIDTLAASDVAAGSRFVPGGSMPSRARYLLSFTYNMGVRILFMSTLSDHLSGYFAIQKSAFQKIENDKVFWGFGDYYLRLLLMARKKNLVIREVPVCYGHRLAGESKTDFVSIFSGYTREVIDLFLRRLTGRW